MQTRSTSFSLPVNPNPPKYPYSVQRSHSGPYVRQSLVQPVKGQGYKTEDLRQEVPLVSSKTYSPSWTELKDLVDGMQFLYPVMVRIEREDDYFIATCPTFSLFVIGDTYEEALQAIKESLVDDYKSFLKSYPEELAESARKLLQLYCAFFGKSISDQ